MHTNLAAQINSFLAAMILLTAFGMLGPKKNVRAYTPVCMAGAFFSP